MSSWRGMREGKVVALVSDAGMPLVSDPGFVLVRACVAAGLAVEVLPGPSAAVAALVASALPADRWRFAGFLPRKRSELERVFESPETLVAFESPRRVAASLAVLASIDPDRPVAVCRELTKLHEEVVRGTAADVAARYGDAAAEGGGGAGGGPSTSRVADRSRSRAGCPAPTHRGRRQAAGGRGRRRRADRGEREPAVSGPDRGNVTTQPALNARPAAVQAPAETVSATLAA